MSLDAVLHIFRAVGEETRLRIMLLLGRGEMTVSELTQILGQSQPRVSRHLKILADAGLVERHREGSWIFYRAAPARAGEAAAVIAPAVGQLSAENDRVIARDRDRFEQSREARAAAAAAYFRQNAAEWDRVRGLHLPESQIEARMRAMLEKAAGGEKREAGAQDAEKDRAGVFVDLGTGTGRMLTVFADAYEAGYGFDLSREMLSVARANLEAAGVANAQVRLGDIFSLPMETASADIVCIHQVLHFLAEPEAAVKEAARLLAPGGVLIISDFAPHDLEFLREEHAHRRLGFSDEEAADWCGRAGLSLVETAALHPQPSKKEGLTVKIWLARAPEKVRKLKQPAHAPQGRPGDRRPGQARAAG